MQMEEEKRFQFFFGEIRCIGARPYNPVEAGTLPYATA